MYANEKPSVRSLYLICDGCAEDAYLNNLLDDEGPLNDERVTGKEEPHYICLASAVLYEYPADHTKDVFQWKPGLCSFVLQYYSLVIIQDPYWATEDTTSVFSCPMRIIVVLFYLIMYGFLLLLVIESL